MTTERILEIDLQQQDALSAELSSRASFVAAISTLAAFLVFDWGRHTTHSTVAIVIDVIVALPFLILIFAAFGLKYSYQAIPTMWIDWLAGRRSELEKFGIRPDEAAARAQVELADTFFRSSVQRTEKNRRANRRKALVLTLSGTIAIVSVLIVLILEMLSKAHLF